MPCRNVTEVLNISLDPDDRIRSYSLTKQTCGGAMGRDSLILKLIEHRPASDIITTPADQFYAGVAFSSDSKEMVYLKHYFAVQSALAAFVGQEARASRGECVIESIQYGPDGVELTALIKVEMLTDLIKACGACATCSDSGIAGRPSRVD